MLIGSYRVTRDQYLTTEKFMDKIAENLNKALGK
jgi:thermostable 8-oxoguanine DNA glycosylase